MIRLSRAQVRQIDELAIQRFKIPGVVLMENAAHAAADVAWAMLAGQRGLVLILCGGGNNGGDGLAVARHLHNRGLDVRIALTVDPAKYRAEALANWEIVQAMGLPAKPLDISALPLLRPILIVDAIFGTGLTEAPREPFPQIVAAVSKLAAPILAIDIPSGLDCDTGKPLGSTCIAAQRTITFVAEKIGFANPEAVEYLGEVCVADIGCPRELVEEVSHSKNIASP
jgi:NAD(P)H-hydrate epimerase